MEEAEEQSTTKETTIRFLSCVAFAGHSPLCGLDAGCYRHHHEKRRKKNRKPRHMRMLERNNRNEYANKEQGEQKKRGKEGRRGKGEREPRKDERRIRHPRLSMSSFSVLAFDVFVVVFRCCRLFQCCMGRGVCVRACAGSKGEQFIQTMTSTCPTTWSFRFFFAFLPRCAVLVQPFTRVAAEMRALRNTRGEQRSKDG